MDYTGPDYVLFLRPNRHAYRQEPPHIPVGLNQTCTNISTNGNKPEVVHLGTVSSCTWLCDDCEIHTCIYHAGPHPHHICRFCMDEDTSDGSSDEAQLLTH